MNRDDPHYFFNFYARRALRIWPIYYLALLPILLAYQVIPTNYPIDSGIIFQYLTYTQDVQLIWGGSGDRLIRAYGHTWSLAIEEQFYLLWPLLVRLTTRRGLGVLSMAIALGSIAVRASGMSWEVLPARCDGFALGSLLALMMTARGACQECRGIYLGFLFATVVVAGATLAAKLAGLEGIPTPWGSLDFPTMGTWIAGPVNALFFGLIGIVVLNAGRNSLAFLRWPPLRYLGTISYGLYLYHIPVMFAAEVLYRKLGHGQSLDGSRPLSRSILELTASILVASLSWRFIERPILGLKRRFHYEGDSGAGAADGPSGQTAHAPAFSLPTTTFST
jgi:peptidoglycan/LPS O-acetylase OafA/YrhL